MASAPPSGEGVVSVNRLTPTTTCSPLSMRRVRSAIELDEPALELVDGLERAAQRQDVVQLGRGRIAQLGCPRLDDVAAVEDVLVLEQVGLEGQHLLHPQRPLLVPRRRQAERLVPRRELHAPGPGPLGQA